MIVASAIIAVMLKESTEDPEASGSLWICFAAVDEFVRDSWLVVVSVHDVDVVSEDVDLDVDVIVGDIVVEVVVRSVVEVDVGALFLEE